MTRKRRNLTDEEQSLWNRIAQKIKPLEPEKRRVRQEILKNSPSARLAISPSHRKKSSLLAPPETPLSFTPSSSTHRIKRIRRVKIEARLDLHGFGRDQARLQLIQFLGTCQNRQCLWVLVITGKGRKNLEKEGTYGAGSQGILRDLLPQWLEELPLRSVVSAYTTAKLYDGGSGALYVRLKRLS